MSKKYMVWSYGKGISLDYVVRKAKEYFINKYPETPNVCKVAPGTTEEKEIAGLAIEEEELAQPYTVWIGRKEKEK